MTSLLLQAFLDPGGAERDLAGHERLAAPRALVVEQDPRAGEQAVGFAIVDRLPVGVELGAGVGAAGMERRVEPLRRRRRAVHLRARRLVELAPAWTRFSCRTASSSRNVPRPTTSAV